MRQIDDARAQRRRPRFFDDHTSQGRARSPTSRQARRADIASAWRIFASACRWPVGLAPLYPEGDLQRLNVKLRFGQQLLELRIFRLELAQPLGFIHL
jgi:hypothetical protein